MTDALEAEVDKGRSVADGPAPAGASTTTMSSPAEGRRHRIGWIRGIASGVLIVLASFALTVLLPNEVLTGSFSMSRDARGVVAFVIVIVMVAVTATGLRRLQGRGLI